jgi:disulfide bond formation protein DsbB
MILQDVSQRQTVIVAAGGSLALLAGAFLFQALGYAPCQMCLWQRWPHAVAIVLGLVAVAGIAPRLTAYLGAAAAFATASIGAFHSGVEQGWWEGPTACSGGGNDLGTLSGADLVSTAIQDTIIMCNEIAWSFMGLSMATWNMVLSLVFVAIWLRAARMVSQG